MGVELKPDKVKRLGLVGAAVVFGGCLCTYAADYFVSKTIKRLTPNIENQISTILGHPLKLGGYQGLRLWGLNLGPTELLPGVNDSSTVKVSSLVIKLAPIASLMNRRPVAIISPSNTEVILNPNPNGSFWVMGSAKKGGKANFDLSLRPLGSTKILFKPSNTELSVKGKATLNLLEKNIHGRIRLTLPENGSLYINGNSYWDGVKFKVRANLKNLNLKGINNLIPLYSKMEFDGNVNGDIKLAINKKGRLICNGNFLLDNFRLKGGPIKNKLSTKKTNLLCDNHALTISDSIWHYGDWSGKIKGFMPLKKSKSKVKNLSIISSIKLKDLDASQLNLKAKLPIWVERKRILTGNLYARIDLDSFPLASLSSTNKKTFGGSLSLGGIINGPLSSLNSDISIAMENPQWNGIRLREKWSGTLKRDPSKGNYGQLRMNSEGASVPGSLVANFSNKARLKDFNLDRLGGTFSMRLVSNKYKLELNEFRLDRVEVALPPQRSFKRIFGELKGAANLSLSPLNVDGNILISYPRLMDLKLKQASFEGKYENSKTSIIGELLPVDKGNIKFALDSNYGLDLRAKANNLSPSWIAKTALNIPRLGLSSTDAIGKVEDLGKFLIDNTNISLDQQLIELVKSKESVQEKLTGEGKELLDADELEGGIDAVVVGKGTNLSNLDLDIKASGKIWKKGDENISPSEIKPLSASFNGQLIQGSGDFSLLHIPISMLSLIAPVPSRLAGRLSIKGDYISIGSNKELNAEMTLQEANIGGRSFTLERGEIVLSENYIKTDFIITSALSSYPVQITGEIPLSRSLPIDLKIESHGDGIAFLGGITGEDLSWIDGTADLSLLIRGSIEDPIANGFVVIKDGSLIFQDKKIENLQSIILFDFNRLEVKQLTADIFSTGSLNSSGSIALFDPTKNERVPLSIQFKDTRLETNFTDIIISTNLILRGSILQPVISGETNVRDGSLSSKRKNRPASSTSKDLNNSKRERMRRLPEQDWDQIDPLVLFIQDENAPASRILNAGFPESLSRISFDNLKLNLGPSLRLVSQPLASFETVGFLILNGRLDESLNASGVIRLSSGYVNLFTTTFNLDRREPNVAIFVPSMGLIPYVDVTMNSRVADNVRDLSGISSSEFSNNGSASFGIGGSRFIEVEVTASGPADRLSESLQLRSSPSMSRSQLLGLIGGNSLTKLLSGGEREVLVGLLNRSFVSFLQGNIDSAFSDRFQLSLYPAYVSGSALDDDNADKAPSLDAGSGSLSPQQAWVTEIGVDLTERINFALQVTPNRKDIPPQGNISFQVNPSIGLLGAFDKEGKWQSQLQLFLRY